MTPETNPAAVGEDVVERVRIDVMDDYLEEAITLAAQFHRGQVDKGGHPYILHPLRVMISVVGRDCQIAAVLHDAVEDCGLELGLIKKKFGPVIADAVDALSRRRGETYSDFIERCGQNEIALPVKWADLTDNSELSRLCRLPTDEDWRRVDKYRRAKDRLFEIASERGQTTFLHTLPQPNP